MTESDSHRVENQPTPPVVATTPNAAPPTEPGELGSTAAGSLWPNLLGVISVLFGGGGLFVQVAGFIYSIMMPDFWAGDPTGAAIQAVQESWKVWNALIAGVSSIAAAVLLVVGIGLLMRRVWSIRLAQGWAAAKIVIVAVSIGIGQIEAQEMQQAMTQANPNTFAGGFGAGSVWLVTQLIFGWTLPIILLWWLSRAKVKDEIATWRHE